MSVTNIINERTETEDRLGSELIQNGNFSELGSELVTNGGFDTDSDWSKGGGWSISEGKAKALNVSGSYFLQNINLTNAKTYKIQFDISDYLSGEIRIRFSGGAGFVSTDYVSGNNTHTLFLQSIGNTEFRFQGQNTFTGSIDNVSVKEVDPNDRWSLGAGFSFGNNVVNRVSSGVGSNLYQNTGSLAGKKVKYSFTVTNFTSGRIDTAFFGASGTTVHRVEANGDYSFIVDVQAGHNGNTGFSTNNTFEATISNISVAEVGVDREAFSNETNQNGSPNIINTVNERVETEDRLGSELVQNGNFSELGSELVTNGDFANGSTGWGLGSNWSVSGGKASCDGSASNSMSQATVLGIASTTFKITYNVSSISQGSLRITLGGVSGASRSEIGTYTDFITASSTDRLRIFADSNAIASIDNISVKQVDPNDRWTLGTGSTKTDTLNIISTDGSLTYGKQQNVLEVGKTYQYSFDITSYTSGSLFFVEGGISLLSGLNATGTYRGVFTATGVDIEFKRGGVTNASFDNISVKEVGVDREAFTNETNQNGVSVINNVVNERTEIEIGTGDEAFTNETDQNGTSTINNVVNERTIGLTFVETLLKAFKERVTYFENEECTKNDLNDLNNI